MYGGDRCKTVVTEFLYSREKKTSNFSQVALNVVAHFYEDGYRHVITYKAIMDANIKREAFIILMLKPVS